MRIGLQQDSECIVALEEQLAASERVRRQLAEALDAALGYVPHGGTTDDLARAALAASDALDKGEA